MDKKLSFKYVSEFFLYFINLISILLTTIGLMVYKLIIVSKITNHNRHIINMEIQQDPQNMKLEKKTFSKVVSEYY